MIECLSWLPVAIFVFYGFPFLTSDLNHVALDLCEKQFYSCDRLQSYVVFVDRMAIWASRCDGDTRSDRERDIRRLEKRKGLDV